jgi:hypothetical protein
VTFRTWENFCTETIQFEVTDFETAYNAFFGRSALSKFMVIPHYAYLVLKMPGPRGVISIRQDIKRAFDCDRKCCETTDSIRRALRVEAGLDRVLPNPVMAEAKTFKMSIQLEDALIKMIPLFVEEPFKVAHIGNNLDPK